MFKLQRVNQQQEKNEAFFDKSILGGKTNINQNMNKRNKRKNMGLSFIEEGSFIKRAEQQRNNLNSSKQLVPMNIKRSNIQAKHHEHIPDIEWWD